MGSIFNQSVDHLPSSLEYLRLGEKFNQPVDKLPPSLTYLEMGRDFAKAVNNLPPNLTHLKLLRGPPLDKLPSNLTHLRVYAYYSPLTHSKIPKIVGETIHFPRHISHLTLPAEYDVPLHNLPNSITHLSIELFKSTLTFPANLTHLTIYGTESSLIANMPPTVTHVKATGMLDFWKINILPPTVTHLTFAPPKNMIIRDELGPEAIHMAKYFATHLTLPCSADWLCELDRFKLITHLTLSDLTWRRELIAGFQECCWRIPPNLEYITYYRKIPNGAKVCETIVVATIRPKSDDGVQHTAEIVAATKKSE